VYGSNIVHLVCTMASLWKGMNGQMLAAVYIHRLVASRCSWQHWLQVALVGTATLYTFRAVLYVLYVSKTG
jgi:hypothetical protein